MRSGAGAWRGGEGTGPSAAGGGIVPHNWGVCTRGPRGCTAGNFCPAALTIFFTLYGLYFE